MSEFEVSNNPVTPLNPTFEDSTISRAMAGLTSNECFQARLLRTSFDIPPADIPEDFEAVRFQGYECSFVAKDGRECTFANPMVFLKHDVGFVAMGHRNFCRLESESPGEFKKAALGSVGVRAIRFGRQALALAKLKWNKEIPQS